MWSLIKHRFYFALVLIAAIARNAEAGVYPNFNTQFDFVPLDASKESSELKASSKWWETASFYQIYPRSFKDSDGDGVGDLKGITQRLDYLKEIGIAAAWLSPIFKSPMADFGYDIANYTVIDPIFGTMDDFDSLIAKAKEIGIKIIVDFVPNHSSDECEWFIKSAARDPDYHDFYVWHPGKMVNGTRHPPTNWISVFRGSAWQWHDGRQEYYLHQFLKKQPDLNYRSPRVRETMKEVLRFWLRKGVAGFRVDAVPFIFEVESDKNGNWPDEPRNSWVNDPDDYGYLNHIYTANQPATVEMVYEWRLVLDEFKENSDDDRILMTEAYAPIEVVMQYYGNATAEGAQVPFNFLLISWVTNDSDAYHYAQTVNTWLQNMPKGRTPNWVIGNHDQNRVGSRLGEDRMTIMNMLIMTLPGCSITYNGEEIGMTDVWISWNDTVDPSACNSNPSIYEKLSRDPERTPFQWSDDVNAGFSTAKKTWLPISENYKHVNVKLERNDLQSILNTYKHLHELRKKTTMRYGATEVKALSRAVLAVKRTLLNEPTYITLLNIFDAEEVIDLRQAFTDIPNNMEYIVVSERSAGKRGDIVKSTSVRLQPKDAIVLRSTTKLTTKSWRFTYYKYAANVQ